MNKTCFFLLLVAEFCHGQNPTIKQWDHSFGGSGDDYLWVMKQTSEGGYLLAGQSNSDISGNKSQNVKGGKDYWIVKTDPDGNKEWDKDFGGTDDDFLRCFQQTSDGGYILGGDSYSGISGDKTEASNGGEDYWIIKINSEGVKQWDKDFGGTSSDFLMYIQQTGDGGYILGGSSNSGIGGDKSEPNWDADESSCDYWLVKVDSTGNKQWDKDFGSIGFDFLNSIYQTSDGGYILSGYSWAPASGDKTEDGNGDFDFWIVKADSLGHKQWDKDIGGINTDWGGSLLPTSDHGYLLASYTQSGVGGDKTQPSWGSYDYWIVKTDSLCNIQWDKDFGGTGWDDDLFRTFETKDHGFLIAGGSFSPISGNKTEPNLGLEQTWVIKTDSLGTIEWDKTILTTGSDYTGIAIQSNDGCYVFANFTPADSGGYKSQDSYGGTAGYDYWFVKFCDSTISIVAPQESGDRYVSVFPNPSNGNFTVEFSYTETSENGLLEIDVVNTLGQKVFSSSESRSIGTADFKKQIDLSNVASGIYFVEIKTVNEYACPDFLGVRKKIVIAN